VLNRFDFDFDPEAKCPKWLEYVEYCFPDKDVRRSLQEFTGHLLTYDNRMQYFMMFLGDGGTGKSTYLETITSLLGHKNVSHCSLDQLGKDFGASSLVGKLANICGDLRDIDASGEGVLKQIVGGDTIEVTRKYKDSISINIPVRFVFAANQMPRFKDKSDGLWRKMVVIPANRKIPKEKKNPSLKDELRDELPGIFNWALEGLRSLRKRNRFVEPDVAKKLKDKARGDLNTAYRFLQEFTRYIDGREAKETYVYEQYKEYCNSEGNKPMSKTKFIKELERFYEETSIKRSKKRFPEGRFWMLVGLAFFPDGVDEDLDETLSGDQGGQEELPKGLESRLEHF